MYGNFVWTNTLERIDLVRVKEGVYEFIIDLQNAQYFDAANNGWVNIQHKDDLGKEE